MYSDLVLWLASIFGRCVGENTKEQRGVLGNKIGNLRYNSKKLSFQFQMFDKFLMSGIKKNVNSIAF